MWWRYYLRHYKHIRPVVVETICRILACGLSTLGFATYRCSNPTCDHTKKICFSCKSRFCNTCGTKRTNQWIENQLALLPRCPWQHITWTLPSELWPLFRQNRHLLGQLSRIAAHVLLKTAQKKGITPGIFTALHTFGRDLKWNVHIHLSITLGGLSEDNQAWKRLSFAKKTLMPQWRYAVIRLLRKAAQQGNLQRPNRLKDPQQWEIFLDQQYQKTWILFLAKPTGNPKHTVNYLGRYISRPPLAMSRLKHYDGQTVTFTYLDHTTKTYRRYRCGGEEFLARWTQHIPEKGFRLIRYYGFLANRVRSLLLPKVYALLDQKEKVIPAVRYPDLLQSTFGLNPLICILCKSHLLLCDITLGKPLNTLVRYHKSLALAKNCSLA